MSDQLSIIEERALEVQAVAVRASSKDVGCPVCQILLKGIPTLADDVLALSGVVRQMQGALRRIKDHDDDGMVPTVDGEWSALHGITSAARVARDALAECNALLRGEEKP